MTTKTFSFSRIQPWVVCLTGALFFFYEFIQMNMLNAISATLMREFSMNAVTMGTLSSIYFYSNVVFLFFAGSILDHYSTRKVILVSLSICILGILLFAGSNSIGLIGVSRFITAIGSAFCFLSCIRLASRWLPLERLALVTGLVVTFAMVGGMVSQWPFAWLVQRISWREALLIDAALGAVIWLAIYAVVWDTPGTKSKKVNEEAKQLRDYLKNFKLAFLNAHNWCCGIYASLMNLPIFILGGLWGIQYLNRVFGLNEGQAASLTSLLFLGTIVGAPFMGHLSDRLGQRKSLMLITACLALALMLCLIYKSSLSMSLGVIVFFLIGFITSAQILSYPLVAERNPPSITATAVSVVSISCLGGGAIFQPFFGWLMHVHHQSQLGYENNLYQAGDYHFAIGLLPVTFVIAFVAAALVNAPLSSAKRKNFGDKEAGFF